MNLERLNALLEELRSKPVENKELIEFYEAKRKGLLKQINRNIGVALLKDDFETLTFRMRRLESEIQKNNLYSMEMEAVHGAEWWATKNAIAWNETATKKNMEWDSCKKLRDQIKFNISTLTNK